MHAGARRSSRLALILGSVVLAAGALAAGDELPQLRRGMWEFTRTVQAAAQTGSPMKTTIRECTSPVDDMKNQNEMLTKVGCRFSPVTRSGNSYSFSAECPLPGGGKGTSQSVLTVAGDSAYTVKVQSEGLTPGRTGKTTEELSARRVGECSN